MYWYSHKWMILYILGLVLVEVGITNQKGETNKVCTKDSERLTAFLKIKDGWNYDS